MRLIDADALLDKVQDYGEGQERLMLIDPYWVRKAQTVERPHGEWKTESAIDYLTEIGWLPEHDRVLTKTPQWIPCSERLPNAECGESNSVLCQLENDTMKVLYWDGGNWCNPTGELYHSVNHKNGWHNRVIAWMPLPTPYREEGDEK